MCGVSLSRSLLTLALIWFRASREIVLQRPRACLLPYGLLLPLDTYLISCHDMIRQQLADTFFSVAT